MTDVDCLVLDSDIVIHLLKKQKQTVDLFVSLHEDGTEFLISPIVVAEVYAGAFRKEHVAIDAFFGLCRPLLLDEKTAKQAGIYAARFRKAYQGISLEDYLLAATAKCSESPLWTGNKKHYPMEDITLFESGNGDQNE